MGCTASAGDAGEPVSRHPALPLSAADGERNRGLAAPESPPGKSATGPQAFRMPWVGWQLGPQPIEKYGAGYRIRTRDLLITNQLLYQLS